MPDFRGRSGYLRVEVGAKQKEWPTAITLEIGKIRENLNAVHAELLLRVKNAAQENFRSDIRRPAESGRGIGQRDRQTGKFTFGTTGGGAFVGNLFQDGDVYGFGYPDIARADAATNFVWRSLEYGLKGWGEFPRALSNLGQTRAPFPRGTHLMPRAFHFSGPEGDPSSVLRLGGGPSWMQHNYRGYRTLKSRAGRGIEGKHFLERAFAEVRENRQLLARGYQTAVQKAIKSFK